MIKNLLSFLKNKLDSEYVVNIMTIMSGTILAQLITVVISPILSRLFFPKDFGLIALFLALSNILSIIATGKYDLAILLPKKKSESFNLLFIALGFTVIFTIVTFIVILFFRVKIGELLGSKEIIYWLNFLPLSILFTGFYFSLRNWNNRNKKYKNLSISFVTKNFSTNTSILIGGLIKLGNFSFLFGNLIGQFFSTSYLLKDLFLQEKYLFCHISAKKISYLIKKYINFPKYSIPADFINTYTGQNPIILLGAYFGSTTVGYFALTQRVLGLPVQLISQSTLEVFKQRASEDFNKFGNCTFIVKKTFKSLLLFSTIPFVIFIIFAPDIFTIIFGNNWLMSGKFAQVLALQYFFTFTVSPLSYVLYIANKQKYDLIWQFSLLLLTTVGILLGAFLNDPIISLFGFSVIYSLMYVIYLFMIFHFAKGDNNNRGYYDY